MWESNMNNRRRKKWLKQHNLYINPRECWNLDLTIADFIVPRLKQFKKDNNGYPGRDDMDTPEKWDAALDKMIRAFELAKIDIFDLPSVWDNEKMTWKPGWEKRIEELEAEKQEGLMLFAKWYDHLWW